MSTQQQQPQPARMRERVTFGANTPVIVRLDGPPKQVAGRFGDQWQYIFDAGARIAWLDQPTHDAIVASGARDGDEIAITKRETRNGNRRGVVWTAELIEEEPAPLADPPPAYTHAAAPATPATANAPSEPDARKMAAAIASAVAACEYTHQQYALNWDRADVRALATTIYISHTRGAA